MTPSPPDPRDPRDPDPELIATARHDAGAAAATAGVVCGEVADAAGFRAAAEVFDRVWGRAASAGGVLAIEALTALAHAGAQVTVARGEDPADEEILGATAAWLGRDHDTGALHLHSHVTGVVAGAEGRGIGRALKWHQRAWALERGIGEVRWTFDPLIRRNAVLNLALLGAGVRAYHVDRYGPMPDARNQGLPTDRLEASWDLAAPRVRTAAAGRVATPDLAALRRAGAEELLAVGPDDTPLHTPTDAPRRLVQVPADVESLRARDPELARAWTAAIRASLGAAVIAGARVTGCTRDGWYVLAPPGGVRELAGRP